MLVFRLLVQLRLRAAAGPAVRAQAATPAGGDVPGRGRARGLGLAGTGSLLVDGGGGDLLRVVHVATSPLEALLDVLVLPFALGAPRLLRHDSSFPRRPRSSPHGSPFAWVFTPPGCRSRSAAISWGARRSDGDQTS